MLQGQYHMYFLNFIVNVCHFDHLNILEKYEQKLIKKLGITKDDQKKKDFKGPLDMLRI